MKKDGKNKQKQDLLKELNDVQHLLDGEDTPPGTATTNAQDPEHIRKLAMQRANPFLGTRTPATEPARPAAPSQPPPAPAALSETELDRMVDTLVDQALPKLEQQLRARLKARLRQR